jgi:hypothetical protein
VKYFAIVDGERGYAEGFVESERQRYVEEFGDAIVGEYADLETAKKAVALALKGWRQPGAVTF